MNFLQPIGRVFLAFLSTAGRLILFTLSGVSHAGRPPFYLRIVGRQMVERFSAAVEIPGDLSGGVASGKDSRTA